MGAITHTLNFRLHPEQAVYIINHAEDKIIFVETPFVPIMEALKDQLNCVEKFATFLIHNAFLFILFINSIYLKYKY